MGEWKAQLSLRIRQDLRVELEQFAARERRKLGNIGEVLLEWAFQQLKNAGSTDSLLKQGVSPRSAPQLSPQREKQIPHTAREAANGFGMTAAETREKKGER
jgi:hypothetical protein